MLVTLEWRFTLSMGKGSPITRLGGWSISNTVKLASGLKGWKLRDKWFADCPLGIGMAVMV